MFDSIQDLYPVHKWISDNIFDGQAWIYNGSAAANGNEQVYVCRVRDMRPGKNSQSHVVMQNFNKEWKSTSSPQLLQIQTAKNIKMDSGPQDSRVFVLKNEIWIVFNMLCADGFRRMHLYNVTKDDHNAIPLIINGKDKSRTEKNWTPLIFNNEIYFIYSFSPLILLNCDPHSGNCKVFYSNNNQPKQYFRGGSPAIAFDKNNPNHFTGYLHTTLPLTKDHKFDINELPTPAQNTKHIYRSHSFKLILRETPKISVGPELCFNGKQIEQIYGIGMIDGTLWGILNVNDCQTMILNGLK